MWWNYFASIFFIFCFHCWYPSPKHKYIQLQALCIENEEISASFKIKRKSESPFSFGATTTQWGERFLLFLPFSPLVATRKTFSPENKSLWLHNCELFFPPIVWLLLELPSSGTHQLSFVIKELWSEGENLLLIWVRLPKHSECQHEEGERERERRVAVNLFTFVMGRPFWWWKAVCVPSMSGRGQNVFN